MTLGASRFLQLFLRYWAGAHCGVPSLLRFLCHGNLGELKEATCSSVTGKAAGPGPGEFHFWF